MRLSKLNFSNDVGVSNYRDRVTDGAAATNQVIVDARCYPLNDKLSDGSANLPSFSVEDDAGVLAQHALLVGDLSGLGAQFLRLGARILMSERD